MNYALNKPYQRLCMSRDLNGQRTKRAVISVCLSSKRCCIVNKTALQFDIVYHSMSTVCLKRVGLVCTTYGDL